MFSSCGKILGGGSGELAPNSSLLPCSVDRVAENNASVILQPCCAVRPNLSQPHATTRMRMPRRMARRSTQQTHFSNANVSMRNANVSTHNANRSLARHLARSSPRSQLVLSRRMARCPSPGTNCMQPQSGSEARDSCRAPTGGNARSRHTPMMTAHAQRGIT